VRVWACLALVLCAACGSGGGGGSSRSAEDPVAPDPDLYFCADDASCPEVLIVGDPPAGPTVAPFEFSGYGDPSLEYDPDTDTLWLAYSWLEMLVEDETVPDVYDLGVSTHLARSDDGGATWVFEREINVAAAESNPDTLEEGWSIHEVSSVVRGGPLGWEILWFKYFTPLGADLSVNQRTEFLYWRTDAALPGDLGDVSQVWARGDSTSPSWGAPLNLSDIPAVRDCVAFTEPAFLARGTGTFVAMLCSFAGSIGEPFEPERVVLFEEIPTGYRYVATVLDGFDAADFGADFLGQPDLSVAQDGTVLLIVTPSTVGANPQKDGCIVFEFEDFESGVLLRDSRGNALARAIITADGNGPGPGLCTYDRNSSSGVMLVIHRQAPDVSSIEFTLRATGIHP